MQTFLPYPSFQQSLRCLDKRRLGKQRVESFQLIKILTGEAKSKAWSNHPACLMWKGYETCLIYYYNLNLKIWEEKGGKNIKLKEIPLNCTINPPPWFGREDFHASHRSNLLRKDKEFYGRYGWNETPDLPYVWPTKKS